MNTRRLRGFSLIELMITIAILGVLTMLALPSFGRWIANTRVRNMAESIQNGLRLTQREAASRNGSVSFALTADAEPACTSTSTESTSGTNWVICAGATAIERGIGQAGSTTAVVTAGFSSVNFDGLGRTDLGGSSQVAITSSSGACETSSAAGIRCLNVLISPGGKVRLCDPLLTAGDPGACN